MIDGEELAELVIDNDVGVSSEASYEVKRIDSDYFAEEQPNPSMSVSARFIAYSTSGQASLGS